MIQRIQTVYLFLAAILMGLLYFFKLWAATSATQTAYLKVVESLPLLIQLAANVFFILVCIFNYKNRKKQIKLCLLSIVFHISFITSAIFKIEFMRKKMLDIISQQYTLAMILPFASIILISIAVYHIRKDEKLIKSLDRLL